MDTVWIVEMAKIVLLFLIFIAVLAIFGRLRLPRLMRRHQMAKAKRCPDCGAAVFDGLKCRCGQKD